MNTAVGKHCLYFGISTYLKKWNIKVSESDIFHLLGGYSFNVYKVENELIPQYELFGNIINFKNLSKIGISVDKHQLNDGTNPLEFILNKIENSEGLSIFANCFYLPYDSKNYRKNYDEHVLVIHSYDRKTQEYLIEDYKYCGPIHEKDLLLAFEKTNFSYLNYSNIDKVTQVELEQQIKSIYKGYPLRFQSEFQNNLETFKQKIHSIANITNEIYHSISCEALSRSILHPNGPIVSREFMADSFRNYNDLFILYNNLAERWRTLAKNLMRMIVKNRSIESIIKEYEDIIELEIKGMQLISKTLG